MKNADRSSITCGRPNGGTAFLFNKNFTPFLRHLVKYENERISVMEILDIDGPIIIINAYFPFRQNGDEHKVFYLEVLGYIKEILNSNPSSRFIILGDLNYNLYDKRSEISGLLRDFLSDYDLCCSHEMDESFDNSSSFTRSCMKSGTYSLLDYVLFSKSLRERVSDCSIIYDGENPSDHVPVQIKLEVVPQHAGGKPTEPKSGKINWSSLKEDDLCKYESVMDELLDSLQVPHFTLHGDKCCFDSSHCTALEQYFQSLVDIIAIAESHLPQKIPQGKGGQGFWTDSLTQLKSDSVASHREWQSAGRPSSGPLFERKKSNYYKYKAELRRQRRIHAAEKSEALSDRLLNKDFKSFWKGWRRASQVNCPLVNRIEDSVTENEISKTFETFYQQIYGADNSDAHHKLQHQFEDRFPEYFALKYNDSLSQFLLTWDDMVSITGKLKMGKSYNSSIKAEHILYGSPKLMVHVHLLFNALLQHGFVPSQFLLGTITPIIKDSNGDINSVDNYRGITLCSVFSHLFESALRLKFGYFLVSDNLQFGFKPKHSTNHAVYTLKSCIDSFTTRDSNVYVSFLDFSKAFDTISHSGLFLKLIKRNVPLCFLLVVMYWYMHMQYDCKWGNAYSDCFSVRCGTKQGGILSPDFFAIYIDDLIKILRLKGIGCHILNLFVACILFADDMTLMAPTRDAMQQLLNMCADYCTEFCLRFNVKKTKVMIFGKYSAITDTLAQLSLGGQYIDFASSCKYLGFHIVSGTHFRFSVHEDLCSFFGSVNSVLSCLSRPRENVQLQLLYTNCVPRLTYGAAIKELTASEKQQLNVAVNNAVRKIFGFRRWESIRYLREFYKFDSIETMFAKAKRRFEMSVANHENRVLRFISSFKSAE